MGLSDFLSSDTGKGLLTSAEDAAKAAVLAKTADSNTLHPALQALLGNANATPSAATPGIVPASPPASLPKVVTGGQTFIQQHKTAFLAIAGLLSVWLVVRLARK